MGIAHAMVLLIKVLTSLFSNKLILKGLLYKRKLKFKTFLYTELPKERILTYLRERG
jgi:hypothetical protein